MGGIDLGDKGGPEPACAGETGKGGWVNADADPAHG